MSLTVLSIAYPFAQVSDDPVGGAEQILRRLARAVLDEGGRSIVVAVEGSTPPGLHLPIPRPVGAIDENARAAVYREIRRAIAQAIALHRPDVIHLHGIDFHEYLPDARIPTIVTLHLPLDWYEPHAIRLRRHGLWLVPVSRSQAIRAGADVRLAPAIENGVDIDAFQPCPKRGYALVLGRVCPEKGIHLALDAAERSKTPLLVAGAVFPYAEHKRYFEREIRPRLSGTRRWLGATAGAAKQRLIASARCLIVPSLVPETSSLVAMEALASGTPVIAMRNGALVDTIEHGRTGLLVDHPDELPNAMRAVNGIAPDACRRAAEARFSERAMVRRYLDAYRGLAAGEGMAPFAEGAAA